MSKELWLQGYHDAIEGRGRRRFWGEHMESKYPPYDEGYEEGLKELCQECGEPAQPDSDPPMCISCLQESSECPPNAGSGLTPYGLEIQEATHLMFLNQQKKEE